MRLFVRTTRRIRLTDAGRTYYERCREALGQLVDAEREATGQQSAAAGVLRISMPTPYAHYRVLPILPAFRERHPQVRVDVHISNRNIDFAEEGFDLAIRGRAPDESNLIARKLEDAELVVVASPAYLSRAGTPASLTDLEEADLMIAGERAAPRGTLTLTAPVAAGQDFPRPLLDEFVDRYPDVTARLYLLDRPANLIDEGIDVALRIAHLADSTLIAMPVGEVRRVPARRIDRRPSRPACRVLRHRFAVDCLRRARSGSAQSADACMMRQASAKHAFIAPS